MKQYNSFKKLINKFTVFFLIPSEDGINVALLAFSAILGMLVSVAKILIGIFLKSFVWAYSGFYSAGLVITRLLILNNIMRQTNQKKKHHTVLIASIILIFIAIAFDMCAMIRELDGNVVSAFPLWIIIPASIYFVFSYITAIAGLIRTKKYKSISYYAIKVICVSGALMNFVLLQRMILSVTSLSSDIIITINSCFSYFIGATLIITALILMVRAIIAIKSIKELQ